MKRNSIYACAWLLLLGSATAQAQTSNPHPNPGDVTWMMLATVLVILMTIPGLALFYGGMVRAKNVLSVLTQVFVTFALIGLLWCFYGYSLAFTEGNAFFGGFDRAFLRGMTPDSVVGTFSKGVTIPESILVAFQLTFAAITPAIIVGAFAERARFAAVLAFMVLWFTFSYVPLAHMVWYWVGPDAYTSATAAAKATASAGFLFQKGALDFAGGTVVHLNAAVGGLVGAFFIGRRSGFGREHMAPHNLPFTMISASLLWVGWFGFNVGSNLEANGVAAIAFLNTFIAACAGAITWLLLEWKLKGSPSLLGTVSGSVGGLVAITPACGFVGPMGAIAMGAIAGAVCLWGVNGLKHLLRADDALDVFGVHGVAGIVGALLTGVFASPALGGAGVYDYVNNHVAPYDMGTQMLSQLWGVVVTIGWSGTVSLLSYALVDRVFRLRANGPRADGIGPRVTW